MWSLLVPVGYNRDPAAHFGYKKVAMILEHTYTVNEEELVTEKDITRSRGKECIWHIYKSYIVIIHSNTCYYYNNNIILYFHVQTQSAANIF